MVLDSHITIDKKDKNKRRSVYISTEVVHVILAFYDFKLNEHYLPEEQRLPVAQKLARTSFRPYHLCCSLFPCKIKIDQLKYYQQYKHTQPKFSGIGMDCSL